MHLQCTQANSLVRTQNFVKSSLSLSSGCLLISFTVCCHGSLLYSKRPFHTTLPNLASCQLVLLKTRFFLSIHIAHKVTPRNRVHKELNFLRLLGSHLLKKHCSMLRAFQVQPGLVQKGHCQLSLLLDNAKTFGQQIWVMQSHNRDTQFEYYDQLQLSMC